MRKNAMTCLLMLCCMSIWADVSIRNLQVAQRWPWNGLVDITYTVECDEADALVEMHFSVHDMEQDADIKVLNLTGDGVTDPVRAGGTYHTIWDVGKDLPDAVIDNVALTVTGTLKENEITETHQLTYTLKPATAKWTVAGQTHASGETVDLPEGIHTVTFSDVNGYSTPVPQTVELNADKGISVTYMQKMYQVSYNLTPDNAKWTVYGLTLESGKSIYLPVGTYQISFSDVDGYVTPGQQFVEIAADETFSLSYKPKMHRLSFNLTPATATWTVNGITYPSGYTVDLPEGSYTVTFSGVEGYELPISRTVDLTADNVTEVSYSVGGNYLVLDLSGGPGAASYPVRYTNEAPNLDDDTCRTTELWLRRIPAGTFKMGSPESELGRTEREIQHEVTITQDYYIGVFEVTQRQYELITGTRRSVFSSQNFYATRPLDSISYSDIRGTLRGAGWPLSGNAVDSNSFLGRLRVKTGNLIFDLPTEAQWEYACRAGTTTALNSGKNLTGPEQCPNMAEVGRYWNNGGADYATASDTSGGPAKVGSYRPNAWGLYDMHGNVWEWCLDWYGDYDAKAAEDPAGVELGSGRVIKGGSWHSSALRGRSAYGGEDAPGYNDSGRGSLGFRLAAVPPGSLTTYSLSVNLTPETARWKVNGQTFASGDTVELREGTYTVTFLEEEDYKTPEQQTVELSEDTNISVEYDTLVTHQLSFSLTPPKATWTVDGQTYASGQTAELPEGTHTIYFSDVDGYDTPVIQTVELTEDITISNSYTKLNIDSYMVIDISGGVSAASYPVRYTSEKPNLSNSKCRTTELWLRRIPAGTFTMGSPADELGRGEDETQHQVTIGSAYYIGVFPVTQTQYSLVTGRNPSEYHGGTQPVENVSYNDLRGMDSGAGWPAGGNAVDGDSFMALLRSRTGNLVFDLPTEAQWEYACRAGSTAALNSGKNLTATANCPNMNEVGRYYYNQNDGKPGYIQHTEVGSYAPNSWGLYDMHGNVYEWCLDWYGAYASAPASDPAGAASGTNRVLRGGYWFGYAQGCRSAARGNYAPSFCSYDFGFRLAAAAPAEHMLSFTLSQPKATWSVNGQTFSSGEMVELPEGTYNVTFSDVEGYESQVTQTVELTGNRSISIVYEESVGSDGDYLVVDLSGGPTAKSYPVSYTNTPPNLADDSCRTTKLWLRKIPAGTFYMGSPNGELGGVSSEVLHQVTISRDFYIGVFEVTLKQYELVMGSRPAYPNLDTLYYNTLPASYVSYDDIRGTVNGAGWPAYGHAVDGTSFMGVLRSKTENLTFDLPTEAQWEYACRASTLTALNSGKDLTDKNECPNMNEVGRYYYNGYNVYRESGDLTPLAKVGSYSPNNWGLYDMHGNVGEWCLDWGTGTYGASAVTDPVGSVSGTYRISRGGSFYYPAWNCRSAQRNGNTPSTRQIYYGFRIASVTPVVHHLSYDLTPAEATWTVNGKTYASGETADLEEGTYIVNFSFVNGYETPAAQKVALNTDKTISVEYGTMSENAYLVVDLSGGTAAASYPLRYSNTGPDIEDDTCRTTELWLRRIPAGTFTMGSPVGEVGRYDDWETQHEVTLSQDYYAGVFEVTQRQYELVMGTRPSFYNNDSCYATRPVENVSYNDIRGTENGAGWPAKGHAVDCTSFLGVLRAKTGNLIFDLPTEAQWEYACRAGTTTALNSGKNLTATSLCPNMDEVGRYYYNGDSNGSSAAADTSGGTAKVGSYAPNAWGLFDMHGNVCEWCLDWYSTEPETDPAGAASGTYRVYKGGHARSYASACRSVSSSGSQPYACLPSIGGFRLAAVPPVSLTKHKLTYNLTPGSATWSVDGQTYASGEEAELLEGTYTVTFSGVDGYNAPLSQTVDLTADRNDEVSYLKLSNDAYLVVDLSGGVYANSYPVRYSNSAPNLADDTCRTTELWLRRIPAGTFIMGSPEDELGRMNNETQHHVTLSKDYYIGVFEVTQRQYELVMGSRPSYFNNDSCYATRPVEDVTYNNIRGTENGAGWPSKGHAVDRNTFLGVLRAKTGNLIFDLPTEAQWEYACRAGTTTALNSGKNLTDEYECPNMDEVGRYYYNCGSSYTRASDASVGTAKVGEYMANAWGLYDMHGNVREWCLDWIGDFSNMAITDPVGSNSGSSRVIRGGRWTYKARSCRSALRGSYPPEEAEVMNMGYGFRLAAVPPESLVSHKLSYNLTPAEARWEINGLTYASDEAVNLMEGTYTVRFTDVAGWTAPAEQTVEVTADRRLSVNYTKIMHQLSYNLTPATATWSVNGQTYASGDVADLQEGTYTVVFSGVDGYNTPLFQTVELTADRSDDVSYAKLTDDAYLVVDLSGGVNATSYSVRYSNVAPNLDDDTCRTTELWLRRIPAGTFTMGSPSGELGRSNYESPHKVTLSHDYYIGVFEVTQRQYELVMGTRPSYFSNDSCYATRPVEKLSYDDIRGSDKGSRWPAGRYAVDDTSFLGILRARTNNLVFDLPTEAQWEYACRAGTTTALNSGKNITVLGQCPNMDEVGRYCYNSLGTKASATIDDSSGTAKVGTYKPNAWGLYDMHGNVMEWCLDFYGIEFTTCSLIDPTGFAFGQYRRIRGGDWTCSSYQCCSARRWSQLHSNNTNRYGYFGFRLAAVAPASLTARKLTFNLTPATATWTVNGQAYSSGEEAVFVEGTYEVSFSGVAGYDTPLARTVELTADTAEELSYEKLSDEAYLVVDLSGGVNATSYPVRYSNVAPNLDDDTCRTTELWLRRVPAGTFTMGSPEDELGNKGIREDETQHQVTLTQDYYIGVFAITQRQYELVMGTRPSYFSNDSCYATRPVEQVSYDDIRGNDVGSGWPAGGHAVDDSSFLGVLRAKVENLMFDLPTEAQWEYACRAGTTSSLNSGKNLTTDEWTQCSNLDIVGRYGFNGGRSSTGTYSTEYTQTSDDSIGTAKVGSYLPNALGLYDMHGNVREWCLDWYGEYSTSAVVDPLGPESGTDRLKRGGNTQSSPFGCRSGYRTKYPSSRRVLCDGFRIVTAPPASLSTHKLSVELVPALATWSVNGQVHGSGEEVELLEGTYTVVFSDVVGYNTPAAQTVDLTGARSISVNYVRKSQYMLSCNLTPGTASWSVNGQTHASGDAVELHEGRYTVTFSDVSGYNTPAEQTVELSTDRNIFVNYMQKPMYSLSYNLTPSAAKWSVDGQTLSSGEVVRLWEGTYTITFTEIEGYDSPVSQTVELNSDKTMDLAYSEQSASDGKYLVVDLTGGPDAESYPVRYTNTAPNLSENTCRTTELWLRRIPAGTFIMGSPESEPARKMDETQHQVTLTRDYYIGVFQVTQKQYELVTGKRPSNFCNNLYYATRPVERVYYENIRGNNIGNKWPESGHAVDSSSFLGKLREKTGNLLFDLPTEAQWEYACRAGTTSPLNSGMELTEIKPCPNLTLLGRYYDNRTGWYDSECETTDATNIVGFYAPNSWGLYDMHGNVWEWCLDWYIESYGDAAVTDPAGPASGSMSDSPNRVLRGGAWNAYPWECRSASRFHDDPSNPMYGQGYGFRLAFLP